MTNHLYDGVKVDANGELVLSTEMMAILCGLSPEEGRAEFERQAAETGRRDRFTIPQAWKRGAKEVQAKYGTNDFTEIIQSMLAEAAVRGDC